MSSKAQAYFGTHPVFSHDEFAAAFDREGRGPRATQSLLRHYVKTERLVRIKRGLYATVAAGVPAASTSLDPFMIAGRLSDDAVLAYHTALAFHGKAYSVHQLFTSLTSHACRPFRFHPNEFRGVPFPRHLRTTGSERLEVVKAERLGVDLHVTSLERTLVDVLDRPDLSGGWEEIWRSLESVEFFALDRVIQYSLKLGNATTIAKVGFFLDQNQKNLMVEERHLAKLQRHRPKSPHYLERTTRSAGRLVEKWNLIVPVRILNREWQEVQ